jgi:LETM1-like protein
MQRLLGSRRGAREIERRAAKRWRHATDSASTNLVNHGSPTFPFLQRSRGAVLDGSIAFEGSRRPELNAGSILRSRGSPLVSQARVLPDIARCSTTRTTATSADSQEVIGLPQFQEASCWTSLSDDGSGTLGLERLCIDESLLLGRPAMFCSGVRNYYCDNPGPKRRSHQYEAVSFFSSSSLKTKEGEDENDSISQAPPVVKAKPEAPRRHRNLLKPLEKTRIPTPSSAPESTDPLNQLSKTSTKGMVRKGLDLIVGAFKAVLLFTVSLPGNILYFVMRPTETKERLQGFWETAKHEANHYWVGTKLLWEEIKTARMLVGKTLGGTALTRRERKQLLRTVSDLFRLIPFSMFVIIPFMEFTLPFALRLFPNMLPSTYQDSLKAEENMKRELKSRIAMAQFFQEYVSGRDGDTVNFSQYVFTGPLRNSQKSKRRRLPTERRNWKMPVLIRRRKEMLRPNKNRPFPCLSS